MKLLFIAINAFDFPRGGVVLTEDRYLPTRYENFSDTVFITRPDGSEIDFRANFTWGYDYPTVIVLLPDAKREDVPPGSEVWVSDLTFLRLKTEEKLLYREPTRLVIPVRQAVDWQIEQGLIIEFNDFQRRSIFVRIKTPFTLEMKGNPYPLNPLEDIPHVFSMNPILYQKLSEIWAPYHGSLVIPFFGGSKITVPNSPDQEAWSITGPAGLYLASRAGGDLLVQEPA